MTFKGPFQHQVFQEFIGRGMELRLFCTNKLLLFLFSLQQCQKFGKGPAVLRLYQPFSNIYHYSFSFGPAFSIGNINFLLKLPYFLCFQFSHLFQEPPHPSLLSGRWFHILGSIWETWENYSKAVKWDSWNVLGTFFSKANRFVGGILASAEGWDGRGWGVWI